MYLSAIYNYKGLNLKKKERENFPSPAKSLYCINLGGGRERGSLPILPPDAPPSRPPPPPLKAMNFEFEREIGFINSQPSLAECLTSFPAVLETFQTSSIKESTLIPPPSLEQTFPSLQPGASTLQRPGSQKQAEDGPALRPPPPLPAAPPAPEFPWMKEKKSAKKPSQTAASSSPVASSVRASGVGSPSGG